MADPQVVQKQSVTVDAYGRMKHTSVVKSIVYGSSARYFGKKRDSDGHTHSWEIYVKPYYSEVTVYHPLKLFQLNADALMLAGKKPVISEYYDEIVFQEPSQFMYDRLMSTGKSRTLLKHETDFEHKKERSHQLIVAAKEEVRSEINDLKESLKEAKDLLEKFSEDLSKAQSGEDVKKETKMETDDKKKSAESTSQNRNQQVVVNLGPTGGIQNDKRDLGQRMGPPLPPPVISVKNET